MVSLYKLKTDYYKIIVKYAETINLIFLQAEKTIDKQIPLYYNIKAAIKRHHMAA